MISQGHKNNFQTLKCAMHNDDACLVECSDRETGKPVIAICAVNWVDGEFELAPFAKLFDGNPYEELNPPQDPSAKPYKARTVLPNLKRMWVNQPSTLQADHGLHGVNVLAHWSEHDDFIDVYFLSGDTMSQRMAKLSLSEGWQ